jgi:hypothetical protein
MSSDTLEPAIVDLDPKTTECFTLRLETALAADGSLIVRVANSTVALPDEYGFLTRDYTQVAIEVKFPSQGGMLTVSTNTSDAILYTDSDGDHSITFYRGSPDAFDVDFSMKAPTPTRPLGPTPGVPSKRVRLLPKIGYPPPDGGEE